MFIDSMVVLFPIMIEYVILFSSFPSLTLLSFSFSGFRLLLLGWLSLSFFILSSRLLFLFVFFFCSWFRFSLASLATFTSLGCWFGYWLGYRLLFGQRFFFFFIFSGIG